MIVIYNFYLPDVTEGDEVQDLIASFIKLIAQSKNTIAMIARKIGMLFNKLFQTIVQDRGKIVRTSAIKLAVKDLSPRRSLFTIWLQLFKSDLLHSQT